MLHFPVPKCPSQHIPFIQPPREGRLSSSAHTTPPKHTSNLPEHRRSSLGSYMAHPLRMIYSDIPGGLGVGRRPQAVILLHVCEPRWRCPRSRTYTLGSHTGRCATPRSAVTARGTVWSFWIAQKSWFSALFYIFYGSTFLLSRCSCNFMRMQISDDIHYLCNLIKLKRKANYRVKSAGSFSTYAPISRNHLLFLALRFNVISVEFGSPR